MDPCLCFGTGGHLLQAPSGMQGRTECPPGHLWLLTVRNVGAVTLGSSSNVPGVPGRWMWVGWDKPFLPCTGAASQGSGCTLGPGGEVGCDKAAITISQCPCVLGSRPLGVSHHCHRGTWTFPSCWLCGSKGTVLEPSLATWGGFVTVTSGHWSHQGKSFIDSPSFLFNSGDELKCSTPRARRTGSTTHWKGVSTGSAGTLCPADGLVGDLLTTDFSLCDPPGPLAGCPTQDSLRVGGNCWCCWRPLPFQCSESEGTPNLVSLPGRFAGTGRCPKTPNRSRQV